jgi:hypothetical protein
MSTIPVKVGNNRDYKIGASDQISPATTLFSNIEGAMLSRCKHIEKLSADNNRTVQKSSISAHEGEPTFIFSNLEE